MTLRVAVVGTGPPDGDGEGMAYHHAAGYDGRDDCTVAACADVEPRRAEAFAADHGVPASRVYESHESMLADVQPDVVSVCVPPASHEPVVVDCVRAGVRAVHCEKPMADSWGGARRMAREADRRDVQLTVNHQRRFGTEWRRAKELLDRGDIGDLRRIETAAPNLFDWGTHCFDLCSMFVDEASPEWVLGALETRGGYDVYDVYHEGQGLALWEYDNGVFGLASTAGERGPVDCGAIDALHRLCGTDGVIEVNRRWGASGALRVHLVDEPGWAVEVDEGTEEDHLELTSAAIDHAIEALKTDVEPVISARRTLGGTELVFGIYESVRRRGRVEFPLEVDDHPLQDMIDRGVLDREG